MRYLALVVLLLSRATDLILCTDAYRGIRPATASELAFLSGRWGR